MLDDSTSSVDTETEHLIREAIADLIKGRTTFVIAQRLSTVKAADLILVLEHGRIVQRGTHDELLRDSKGIYRSIYELQLRPQEEASHKTDVFSEAVKHASPASPRPELEEADLHGG